MRKLPTLVTIAAILAAAAPAMATIKAKAPKSIRFSWDGHAGLYMSVKKGGALL